MPLAILPHTVQEKHALGFESPSNNKVKQKHKSQHLTFKHYLMQAQ